MAGNGILEVTDANFDQDVLKAETPVLVDFWAAWCGPCRAIAPIVDELATQYAGKVKIGKMDVDRNSATPKITAAVAIAAAMAAVASRTTAESRTAIPLPLLRNAPLPAATSASKATVPITATTRRRRACGSDASVPAVIRVSPVGVTRVSCLGAREPGRSAGTTPG